jgi:hypothetical protein
VCSRLRTQLEAAAFFQKGGRFPPSSRFCGRGRHLQH